MIQGRRSQALLLGVEDCCSVAFKAPFAFAGRMGIDHAVRSAIKDMG